MIQFNDIYRSVNKEKIEIESDAVSIIVRAADGSMRDGLSLLDQAITIQNSKIKSKENSLVIYGIN